MTALAELHPETLVLSDLHRHYNKHADAPVRGCPDCIPQERAEAFQTMLDIVAPVETDDWRGMDPVTNARRLLARMELAEDRRLLPGPAQPPPPTLPLPPAAGSDVRCGIETTHGPHPVVRNYRCWGIPE